jgi:hypothetical protein
MKMTKKAAKALEGSIDKWQTIVNERGASNFLKALRPEVRS